MSSLPSSLASLIPLLGLALAGVIVLVIWVSANSKRAVSGRSMIRSIPEGITRAKQKGRHVLVFFLDPADELTPWLLDLAFDEGLARALGSFERVRVDAAKDDLDVVSHVASKYGLPTVDPPTLLVLDRDGRRLDALIGREAVGTTRELGRERFVAFLERARARF